MDRTTTFSAVPVGQEIEYQGIRYLRFTYERGKRYVDGKLTFKHIPKHNKVIWINSPTDQIGR